MGGPSSWATLFLGFAPACDKHPMGLSTRSKRHVYPPLILLLVIMLASVGTRAAPPQGAQRSTIPLGLATPGRINPDGTARHLSYLAVSGGFITGVGKWAPTMAFATEANFGWQEGWGVNVILSTYPLKRLGGNLQLLLPIKAGPSFTYVLPWGIALTGRMQSGIALDINPAFPSPVRPYLEMGAGLSIRLLANYPWNILLSGEALFLSRWALSARAGLCYSW